MADDAVARPGWTTHVARHQAPLDEALLRLQATLPRESLLVVCRTGPQRIRLGRMLAFPNQVLTLGEFLGLAGPEDIRDEDLLPSLVARRIVERALPPDYQGKERAVARRHLAHEVEKARHLLAQHGLRVDPRRARARPSDLSVALLAAQEALDPALEAFHEEGLWEPGERVTVAASGPSRLRTRFPTVTHIALMGLDTLSPMERAALERVVAPAEAVACFAVGDPPAGGSGDAATHPALALTADLIAWSAPKGQVHDHGVGPSPRAAALRHLFGLEAAPRETLAGVMLDRPRTRHDEVDDTLHRIVRLLESEVPAHEIALVVPRLGDYAGVLAERLTEHGIPYAMSHPGATRATPSGTLLRLVLESLAHDHPRDTFLDILGHPLVRLGGTMDDGTRRWADAAWLRRGLAARGQQPRGLPGWERAFGRLRTAPGVHLDETGHRKRDPDWTEGDARRVATARELLLRLQTVGDAPDAARFFDGLRGLFDHLGVGRGVAQAARTVADPARLLGGHDRVLRLIDDAEDAFRLIADEHPTADDAADALERALWKDALPPTGDLDHGIQVLGLRNVRGLVHRHVFLLGAKQGDLPPPPDDDMLRSRLEALVGQPLERLDADLEARRILHGLLADTTGTVTITCPREEDDAEVPESVLLAELRDAYETQAVQPLPARATSRRLRARAAGRHDVPLEDAGPVHGAARDLVTARATGTMASPYAGRITVGDAARARAEAVLPTEGGRVSASKVETYAACPMKALFAHGLRLDAAEVRDERLDPRDKGELVHAILHRYTTEAFAQVGRPFRVADDPEADARMLRHAIAVIDDSGLEGLHFEAFKIQLLGGLPGADNPYHARPRGLLRRFLDEERKKGRLVLDSEAGYGPRSDHTVTLDTVHGPLALSGRIDRIDRFPDADALRVIDYKTGRADNKLLEHNLTGVRFQLGLYAHAATTLHPGHTVREAGYIQLKKPTKDDMKSWFLPRPKKDEPGSLERLIEEDTPRRLGEIVGAAQGGHWNLTLLDPKDAGCEHCDHRRICGLRPHLLRERRHRLGDPDTPRDERPGYVPDHVETY